MKIINIVKISIVEENKLAIFVAESNTWFEYIYREAAGVYWDRNLKCFKSTEMRDWDCKKWFMHIVTLIYSTFDIMLLITGATVFQSEVLESKDEFIKEIENFNSNSQDR